MVLKKTLQTVVAAAFALAVAAGCGNDDGGGNGQDSGNQATNTAESQPPSSESGAPGQNEGGDKAAGGLQGQLTQLLDASPIRFDPESAELTEQSKQTIKQVAEAANANPDAKLEIVGTAGYDDKQQAEQLGQQRADAVKKELAANGVAEDRMQAKSMANDGVVGDEQKAVTADISVVS